MRKGRGDTMTFSDVHAVSPISELTAIIQRSKIYCTKLLDELQLA